MYGIKKLNKISPVIEEVFDEKYSISDDETDPVGIIVRSYDMSDYAVNNNLLAIGRAGAGVNNIPVRKMTEKGIVVFNTPGANANAVKELTVLAMLLASRDVIGGNLWVNALETDVAKTAEKGKSRFAGREIFGKKVGVVGLGAIGVLVGNACVNLGMEVVGYDPYLTDSNREKLDKRIKLAGLDEVLSESDIITLHLPLLDGTKNLIDDKAVEKMKNGVILINMSRGGLVDFDAVKKGIACGKIAKYVVDFPDEKVIRQENVIVFPHLGASTDEAEDNCARSAAEQLKDYIENGNVLHSVNFPSVNKPRTDKIRTCVFATTAAKEYLENLPYDKVIGEKNGYVYAIIDAAEDIKSAADGIIRVRKIV